MKGSWMALVVASVLALTMGMSHAHEDTNVAATAAFEGVGGRGTYSVAGTAVLTGAFEGAPLAGATYSCTASGSTSVVAGTGGVFDGTFACNGGGPALTGSFTGVGTATLQARMAGVVRRSGGSDHQLDCTGQLAPGRNYPTNSGSFALAIGCTIS